MPTDVVCPWLRQRLVGIFPEYETTAFITQRHVRGIDW